MENDKENTVPAAMMLEAPAEPIETMETMPPTPPDAPAEPMPPTPLDAPAEPMPQIDFDAFVSAIMASMSNNGGILNKLKVLTKLGLTTISKEYPSDAAFHAAIKPFVNQLLTETKAVLKAEDPMCAGNREHGRLGIIGDNHGDLKSLLLILSNFILIDPSSGKISLGDTTLVFLGDLTDRGKNGLFVCMLIFALKCMFPNQVILISGNHEDRQITHMYGFEREMIGKGMQDEYDFIIDEIFPLFRIFWVLGENMFVHGGIPSDQNLAQLITFSSNGNKLQMKSHKNNLVPMSSEAPELDEAQKKAYREHWMRIEQVRWADPTCYTQNFIYSSRGCGEDYGAQVVHDFLDKPIIAEYAKSTLATLTEPAPIEPLKVVRVFRGHSHGEKYPEYEDYHDGGGNVLFGGYIYIVWSVGLYANEIKDFGFMVLSAEIEDRLICPALHKVDRLSTDTLTYYAVTSDLDFEQMGNAFEQMLPTNGADSMLLFWELTSLGSPLPPSTSADDNTPFPSRSNSNA